MMTRAQAITRAKDQGFITLIRTGESGDHGYGSRLYFGRDGAKDNPWPVEYAVASKVGENWTISFFPHGPTTVF